ncbi:MAG: hypothetical protein PHU44_13495 [Syntrophales bacterium]|nr:hypothetical protein [Syntrophales bacterium]MDD5641904.1 hypothetical protein [Syntrophales bacterium]
MTNRERTIIKRESLLAILQEFKKDYAEKYGILEIGIFGSMSRDEAREDGEWTSL